MPLRAAPVSAQIAAIQEVRVEIGVEQTVRVRSFYRDLFGLNAWPSGSIPGGTGLGPQRRGIYLRHAHDPRVDANRPRLRLLVGSLHELKKRLRARPWPFIELHTLELAGNYFLLRDPVGHLLEVRQSSCL